METRIENHITVGRKNKINNSKKKIRNKKNKNIVFFSLKGKYCKETEDIRKELSTRQPIITASTCERMRIVYTQYIK